ncbi:MAG: MFS transporter [Saccharolobus sp.]
MRFSLGYIIVQILAGILSDYVSAKNLLFLSLIGIFISSLISGSFISLLIRYIVSFLMGFSAGWIYPLTVKLIGNIFNGKELPIAMSIYSLAWSLSIIASGIIIPFLTINLGWEFPFLFHRYNFSFF